MARLLALALCGMLAGAASALAADLSADEVRAIVAQASAGTPPDLSHRSLQRLDLSGLDFKRANLAGADLYGAKLVDANLSGANLSGATLNLAWIMRANFTDANLSGASLQGMVVSSGLEVSPAEAPVFRGANFQGARIIARFSSFDLTGANFSHAMLGADMRNQSMGLMRTEFSGAKLAHADFAGADLGRALLSFADLSGANLAGASLRGADLSGANLTGADLTKADCTDADFGHAVLKDAKGLDTVIGQKLSASGG